MIRHWTRHLRTERDPRRAAPDAAIRVDQRLRRSRCPATVLVVVLVTKFLAGAWIAIARDGRRSSSLMRGIQHALRPGRRRARRSTRTTDGTLPSRVHAIVLVSQDAQADAAGARLRAGVPAQHARGGDRRRRPGRDRRLMQRVGRPRHPGAAQGRSTRRTARSPGRSSTTSRDPPRQPARRRRRSTSPSTSSATGGSSCCTTRARCGSRAGCCSRRASWSRRCRGSCARPGRRRSARSGRPTCRARCGVGHSTTAANRSRPGMGRRLGRAQPLRALRSSALACGHVAARVPACRRHEVGDG